MKNIRLRFGNTNQVIGIMNENINGKIQPENQPHFHERTKHLRILNGKKAGVPSLNYRKPYNLYRIA